MTTATRIHGRAELAAAAEAVRETCNLQLGLTLRPMPDDGRETGAAGWCRSGIDLAADGGCWRLTLLTDAQSARRLTQRLFGLDPDEDPGPADLADALKELINIAAGVFKRDRCEPGLRISLPDYAESRPTPEPGYPFAGSVRLAAGPRDPQVRVLLVWRDAPATGGGRHEP